MYKRDVKVTENRLEVEDHLQSDIFHIWMYMEAMRVWMRTEASPEVSKMRLMALLAFVSGKRE